MNSSNPVKTLLKSVGRFVGYDSFAMESYSQEGEDRILARLFNQKTGFYVDVGAHHPRRFSNTFLFYKRGWSGINIDAMPSSMDAFCRERPRDINLEIPIARERKTLTYFEFNDPALNSFSETLSHSRKPPYKIIATRELETYPLKDVLEKYMPQMQQIDFLSVDVEGLDFEALQSNDWLKFRPSVVLVEDAKRSISHIQQSPIYQLLLKYNYQLYAKSANTCFYLSDEFLESIGKSTICSCDSM